MNLAYQRNNITIEEQKKIKIMVLILLPLINEKTQELFVLQSKEGREYYKPIIVLEKKEECKELLKSNNLVASVTGNDIKVLRQLKEDKIDLTEAVSFLLQSSSQQSL